MLISPYSKVKKRPARRRNNVNFNSLEDMASIFNCIHNYVPDHIKNTSIMYEYF